MLLFPKFTINKSRFLKSNFPNSKIKYRRLGNIIINDVLLLKPNVHSQFVLKNFDNIFNIIKWTFLTSFTFYSSKYLVSGYHRAINEIKGLKWSEKIGSKLQICAPKVYERLGNSLIIEFVYGTPIDDFTKFSPLEFFSHYKKVGSLLCTMHSNNLSFGDFKAENILYNKQENKYYFLDFEQFREIHPDDYVRRSWDLTELFFYLGHVFPSKKSYNFFKKLIFTFLTSYYSNLQKSTLPTQLKKKMFQELGRLRYIIIYATFMNPRTFFFVLRTIQEWKNSFREKFQ